MKLIDAKAWKIDLLLLHGNNEKTAWLINRINHAPTVDAEPVRHGKWIRDEFGTRCGACGLYAYRDKFDQPWESPYCPNCGAKMDGERK